MLDSRRLLSGPWRILLVVGALVAVSVGYSFPPAPYYTIYGDVRDAHGDLLPIGEASVILYSDGQEVIRQTLSKPGGSDHNYQLRLRIDMMRAATGSYSSIAMNPGSVYTIAIEVGGQLFHPLEITNPPQVGNPADRQRFDLTLGVDIDGDGLPDAWEEAQLFAEGFEMGPEGWDLSLIDRDSDFNDDGISNWAAYTAGTYASDSSSVLALSIKQFLGDAVRLEFYAIYGRIYNLETSSNLTDWTPIAFAASPDEASDDDRLILQAETTGVISVYARPQASQFYYRLISR